MQIQDSSLLPTFVLPLYFIVCHYLCQMATENYCSKCTQSDKDAIYCHTVTCSKWTFLEYWMKSNINTYNHTFQC